ncbi:helix-turn-helix domain-containing protein [Spirillospora sp. NPDC047279]|uniref:TetR/AcrR family transcriptional regulator n=1 Tax=Spirillospora sp. NPDC047279 TaxID=3155478 RepID=UPI0033F28C95
MPARPLRADAARNRAKILQTAEAVFAELGTSASTEEIARRAGVGIGTVFRHFPTKESLLEAVLAELVRGLAEEADALLAADDPEAAFFTFFTGVVQRSTAKNAVMQALAAAGVATATDSDTAGRLRAALATLLERAQHAGAVRADIGVREVMALLVAASRAVEEAPMSLEVITSGLRPA